MQTGSLIRAERSRGQDVWEFRWRETGATGKRIHRRLVLGTLEQLPDEGAARRSIAALSIEINHRDIRFRSEGVTLGGIAEHYRQRELTPDTVWKTHSTKVTYEGYLAKWILPRWGAYPLSRINAGEVELWLRSVPLAGGSCTKIRNLMSVLFSHAIRHELFDRNPIRLVRQSAKRRTIPLVLTAAKYSGF